MNSKTLEQHLLKLLRNVFDNHDFMYGMLEFVYDDEDRRTLIDFIENGEDVTTTTVTMLALDLCDKRDELNS